jgi:hypothetical protein
VASFCPVICGQSIAAIYNAGDVESLGVAGSDGKRLNVRIFFSSAKFPLAILVSLSIIRFAKSVDGMIPRA